MTAAELEGLVPIVPTPFDDDGAIDLDGLGRVVDYLIKVGVQGVAVLGMASEAIALTDAERTRVITATAERVDGRVPIVAGCFHNSPQAVAQLAADASGSGADVLMVMPATLGTPDQQALRDYFVAAADASDAAVMIQDNPGWHGIKLPIGLYEELARHDNIRYAKIETRHPPSSMGVVGQAVGEQLVLFGGQGGMWLPEELRRGSRGVMPAAIMPQVYLLVWQLWSAGREREAVRVFNRYSPMIRITGAWAVGIPMAKVALRAAGVLGAEHVRAPFRAITEADRVDLLAVMSELGLIDIMRGEIAPTIPPDGPEIPPDPTAAPPRPSGDRDDAVDVV